jgi:large subunit ribosomal protein L3
MSVLLGTKIGMTRVFTQDGRTIPVTAVQTEVSPVTQRKTVESDGYSAVQIGFGVARHPKQPQAGHTKTLDHTPHTLQEFRIENEEEFNVGQMLDCKSFSIGEKILITSTSKGKGFAGVIKRHHFHRGPETHGSDHHRAPGSIGSMFPQHVLRGQKMPGRMGNEQVTVRKVEVVDIDPTTGVMLLKGPVPGTPGVIVRMSSM